VIPSTTFFYDSGISVGIFFILKIFEKFFSQKRFENFSPTGSQAFAILFDPL